MKLTYINKIYPRTKTFYVWKEYLSDPRFRKVIYSGFTTTNNPLSPENHIVGLFKMRVPTIDRTFLCEKFKDPDKRDRWGYSYKEGIAFWIDGFVG